jgi:hypothetical protein
MSVLLVVVAGLDEVDGGGDQAVVGGGVEPPGEVAEVGGEDQGLSVG